MDPASKIFVLTVTTKDVSTADLVASITFYIFSARKGSSNYRGIARTIVYLWGIKTPVRSLVLFA